MRLRTNTGLYFKGRTGGLFLDTGSTASFLPLSASALEQIAGGDGSPGVTTIRSSDSNSTRPADCPARDVDVELCFVCKKCKSAFVTESSLLSHQRQCFGGAPDARGAFRIVQPCFECKLCAGDQRFRTAAELRQHCASEAHRQRLPPPESPLTHEMEDVVNQITLLAARAAQDAGGPAKRLAPPPADVATH